MRPSASRREGEEDRGAALTGGQEGGRSGLGGRARGIVARIGETCLSLWFSPFGARCSSLFFYFLTW